MSELYFFFLFILIISGIAFLHNKISKTEENILDTLNEIMKKLGGENDELKK